MLFIARFPSLLAIAMLLNCGSMLAHAASPPSPAVAPVSQPDVFPGDNPLGAVSTLPFEAPQFYKIKDTDYQPAIEAGIVQ